MSECKRSTDGYHDIGACVFCGHPVIESQAKRIAELEAKNKYKDEVIDQRNAECSRQFKQIERLRADLKHAESMCDCWKTNARALTDEANKAEAKASQAESVLLECTMNHAEAHYIAQAELDRLAALKGG